MKSEPDIDIMDMLAAMLEDTGQCFDAEAAACPDNGSLWTAGYPGSIERSESALPLITGYKFEDACKAVFCITSWYQNRSAQGCAVSLHAALASAEAFGENPIATYEDFKVFYEKLERLNIVSSCEDYVVPVMGHTRLSFRDRWWPALYGCGMIHEYSRLCFADFICPEAGKADEFESLLGYAASMCAVLDGGGWDGEEVCDVDLHLPPESHWDNVGRWFEEPPCARLPAAVMEVLGDKGKPIEKIHFIKHNGAMLPLFNPSILTDYLDYCCDLLDTRVLTGAVDACLAFNADHIYASNILNQKGLFLWPRFKLADKYIENCPVAFMLFDETGCLTLFFDSFYDDGNLEELCKALVERSSDIQIYESVKRDKGYRGLGFKARSVKTVNLVAFANDIAPVAALGYVGTSKVADVTCGALDLLSIVHAASSVEEINAYFTALKQLKGVLFTGISGIFPHFWFWRDNGHNTFSGAEGSGSHVDIFTSYNDNDLYYCEFFNGDARHCPFADGSYPYGSPFRYCFRKNDQGFVSAIAKAEGRNTGDAKRLGDSPCFLRLCADVDAGAHLTREELEREIEAYGLSRDVLTKLVNSLEEDFCALARACGGIICFEYVCETSERAECLALVDEKLGIRAKMLDAPYAYVCYSFDKRRFAGALMDAADRSVECCLGAAVVSAVKGRHGIADSLIKAIGFLRCEKKLVDMKAVKMPYVWHRSPGRIEETDISKIAAIKTVAIAADGAGIQPGVYGGEDANRVFRGFQGSLTSAFKKALGKYNAEELVKNLYEACGNSSHGFFIHTGRIVSFDRIDEREAQRLKDGVLDLREDARALVRASRYCIETMLAYRLDGEERASAAELAYLLSLAVQCIGVGDAADVLYFNPKGFSIEVKNDKTISVLESDELVSKSRDIKMRSIADPGRVLEDVSVDLDYVGRSKAAFKEDTGVSFECFLSVLDELALGVESNEVFSFVRPNVVSASRGDLVTYLGESFNGRFKESDVRNCIGFLTIDGSTLNVVNGAVLDYVPFGRVKDRPNRLELKPLILFGDRFVYSPVCAGLLKRRWMEGIAQRFLPTKAFASLNGVIEQWKRHYEKALEKDVRDCFLSHGFDPGRVFKGLYLHKHGSHPQCLGDYDCLAYDTLDETVWCIECKEFEKVDSAFDYYQLQQRWFGEKGKLQKFERRVLYLNSHLGQIASDLDLPHSDAIKVRPYLVSNKLFTNMIGESSFEVVTLNELDQMLDGRT